MPLLAFSAPRHTALPLDGGTTNLQADLTNDLRLEISGITNDFSDATKISAFLTIHYPLTDLTNVYGAYFSTNPFVADSWSWLCRCTPGQTDLVLSNLPADLGFFRLGPPTAIRPGFDEQEVGPNDDWYTDLVPIGFSVNFFGLNRTNLYVNNNGSVTFDHPLGSYTPQPLESPGTDIIAPFWADVDTRALGSLPLTYGAGTADGRLAFGVNWIDVGYFSCEDDKLNTFQLIFIDRSDRADGDYDVEFNYSKIQWETGEASGGIDGLGGSPARVGFASINAPAYEMDGSGVPGYFLDDNVPFGLIYGHFNSTVPGRYVMQFHDGVPLATP